MKNFLKKLSAFERDIEREKKLVKPYFYRRDWSKEAKILKTFKVDEDMNLSSSKVSRDVNFNKPYWTGLFNSFIGKSTPELIKAGIYDAQKYALEHQINDEVKSVLMCLSMTNPEMKKLSKIMRDSPIGDEYRVVVVNGDHTTNEESQKFVRSELNRAINIDKKKGVWILASSMCQRSFSIPEINVVIIAYDGGKIGPLIQKISRVATIGCDKTVGHVISISIDGQRDTRLFDIVADAAKKYSKKNAIDYPTALKKVAPTFPLFDLDENGHQIQLSVDDYCREIFNSSNSQYLIVNKEKIITIDTENCKDKSLEILARLDSKIKQKLKCLNELKKGRTFIAQDSKEYAKIEKGEKDFRKQLKEKLDQISDKIHYLAEATLTHSFDDAISVLKGDCKLELDFHCELGVGADDLNTLVMENYLDKQMIENNMKNWNDLQNSSWNLIK